jgi:porin
VVPQRPSLRSLACAIAFAAACARSAEVEASGSAEAPGPHRIAAVYTGESWRNTHGGLRTGNSYLDNLDVQIELDGERAWGIPGLRIFGYVLYNNGGTVSEDRVGDAQAVSNIEALKHWRMYELWTDWALGARQAASLRVGLYDLNSEFDTSEVAALFAESAHGIGTAFGQTGHNGPSIFPVTSLAARLRWQATSTFFAQLVALDAVPGDPDHPSSSTVRLDSDEGTLWVAEVGRQANDQRLRKISAGAWAYSVAFDDLLQIDAHDVPVGRHDNIGAYALAELRMWNGGDSDDEVRVDGYARAAWANGRINRFDKSFALGVVATGLLPARPADQLGLALAIARNGGFYRRAQELEGVATDTSERAVELTYRAELGEWLTVQPSLHYVVNPDTNPSRKDALAFALRFELSWERSWSMGR